MSRLSFEVPVKSKYSLKSSVLKSKCKLRFEVQVPSKSRYKFSSSRYKFEVKRKPSPSEVKVISLKSKRKSRYKFEVKNVSQGLSLKSKCKSRYKFEVRMTIILFLDTYFWNVTFCWTFTKVSDCRAKPIRIVGWGKKPARGLCLCPRGTETARAWLRMSGYIRTVSSAHRHIVLDLHRDMKILVLTALVASCCAAPQVYPAVSAPSALVYAQSNSPAVMKIPEPGINLGAPLAARAPVAPVVAAPVPFVQSAAPIPVAPAAPLLKTAAVVSSAVPVPVAPAAPIPVAPAAPFPVAPIAPMVKSAVPVTVVAPPEPLMAPEPPMPSLSVPHVGGQFHAQDEAGQYSFGHYGGPNTRVETRDFMGRTFGSFAYMDSEGDVQVRKYAAAPLTGFRVAATDLVEDTIAVAEVKSILARARAANSLVTPA
nr:uncharacterized protein LOC113813136 [Penaeus vannamei]